MKSKREMKITSSGIGFHWWTSKGLRSQISVFIMSIFGIENEKICISIPFADSKNTDTTTCW